MEERECLLIRLLGLTRCQLESLYKDNLLITLPFVTSIINASLLASTFPEVWKTAEITPIPKQGNHKLPNKTYIVKGLRGSGLQSVCHLFDSQGKAYHKTKRQQKMVLYWHIFNSHNWYISQIDMSKVFDSVDHQIFLRKIQSVNFGASTSTLKWFISYLTNIYQVVRIHSSVSDPLPVECGVPSGSILGPLLFSIYVKGLAEVPRHFSTEYYVDDTKLFVSFNYTTPNGFSKK